MADKRVIVVGDLHGCLEELKMLLQKVDFRQGIDEVICVGDLVGKGPASVGVIKYLRSIGARSVCGNWDFRARNQEDFFEQEWNKRILYGHVPSGTPAPTLSEDDRKWFNELPHYILLPEHNVVVVHGGFVPGVPLEKQEPKCMREVRNITSEGWSRDASSGAGWAELWKGPQTVIFGHDAKRGLQEHQYAIGLDTGCVYGRQLSAYLLPERRLVTVPALAVHSPPKTKPTVPSKLAVVYEHSKFFYRQHRSLLLSGLAIGVGLGVAALLYNRPSASRTAPAAKPVLFSKWR